jgi:hypothetical protein
MDITVNMTGSILNIKATVDLYWMLVLLLIIVSCKAVPVVIDVAFAIKQALVLRELRKEHEAHRQQVRKAKQLANEVFK